MPGFYARGRVRRRGHDRGRRRPREDPRRLADRGRRRRARPAVGGLHTNGYSLARKVFFEELGLRPADRLPGRRTSRSPTRCSRRTSRTCAALEPLLEEDLVHGMAHITGGGFYDNIPRVLPRASTSSSSRARGRCFRSSRSSRARAASPSRRCTASSTWGSAWSSSSRPADLPRVARDLDRCAAALVRDRQRQGGRAAGSSSRGRPPESRSRRSKRLGHLGLDSRDRTVAMVAAAGLWARALAQSDERSRPGGR